MSNILLTGGTGLLGKKLTKALLNEGHSVNHLSRKPGNDPKVKTYLWDVNKGEIDKNCVQDIDTIVHLAGAGIADERWTNERKKELVNSRTKSIRLIYQLLKEHTHTVKTVISASATGYYGDRDDELLPEASAPGNDFLSNCCMQWEHAVDEGEGLGLCILKFRTGVVLSGDGGALPKMSGPIKFGVGSPLGSGKQWIPWIHEQDVLNMYLFGIAHPDLSGVYNMVAPNPVTNKQFTQIVAKHLHRPLWLPKVPAFILKLVLGEMSAMVLNSTKASAQKIEKAGYQFKYPALTMALENSLA